MKDVTLLAVRVVEQRNVGRAVRIVFDRSNSRRDTGLVALEIDDTDLALMSATTMPNRRVTTVATSTAALFRLGQRLVRPVRRDLVIDQRRLETQSRSHRSECLNRHILLF